MVTEEQYKQEMGKDAISNVGVSKSKYTSVFIRWMKDHYELEHNRRIAAEEVINVSLERELIVYHDEHDCRCIFCNAVRNWQKSVKAMEKT